MTTIKNGKNILYWQDMRTCGPQKSELKYLTSVCILFEVIIWWKLYLVIHVVEHLDSLVEIDTPRYFVPYCLKISYMTYWTLRCWIFEPAQKDSQMKDHTNRNILWWTSQTSHHILYKMAKQTYLRWKMWTGFVYLHLWNIS